MKTKTFFSDDNQMVGTVVITNENNVKIGYLHLNNVYAKPLDKPDLNHSETDEKNAINISEQAFTYCEKNNIELISF